MFSSAKCSCCCCIVEESPFDNFIADSTVIVTSSSRPKSAALKIHTVYEHTYEFSLVIANLYIYHNFWSKLKTKENENK